MRLIIVTMVSFLNATEHDCPSHQHPEIKCTWCTKALRICSTFLWKWYFWELFESLSQNILTASCPEFVRFVSWSTLHVGFTKDTSILHIKQISVRETDQIFGCSSNPSPTPNFAREEGKGWRHQDVQVQIFRTSAANIDLEICNFKLADSRVEAWLNLSFHHFWGSLQCPYLQSAATE